MMFHHIIFCKSSSSLNFFCEDFITCSHQCFFVTCLIFICFLVNINFHGGRVYINVCVCKGGSQKLFASSTYLLLLTVFHSYIPMQCSISVYLSLYSCWLLFWTCGVHTSTPPAALRHLNFYWTPTLIYSDSFCRSWLASFLFHTIFGKL